MENIPFFGNLSFSLRIFTDAKKKNINQLSRNHSYYNIKKWMLLTRRSFCDYNFVKFHSETAVDITWKWIQCHPYIAFVPPTASFKTAWKRMKNNRSCWRWLHGHTKQMISILFEINKMNLKIITLMWNPFKWRSNRTIQPINSVEHLTHTACGWPVGSCLHTKNKYMNK